MEHYPNAPIIEAILDIQVRSSAVPEQAAFTKLAKELAAAFPQASEVNELRLNVGLIQGASSVAHSVGASGLRLSSPAADRVLLIQPRGMTFSHLPPYTEWALFRSEALAIWKRYVEFLAPVAVTRTALRYINRIHIPGQRFELSDYFFLYPHIPEKIPQDLSAFFNQFQMPQTDLGADVMAVINFATTGPREDGARGIMLDLDVFAARDQPTHGEEVFQLLDILRKRKNELFEACITDKCREFFK